MRSIRTIVDQSGSVWTRGPGTLDVSDPECPPISEALCGPECFWLGGFCVAFVDVTSHRGFSFLWAHMREERSVSALLLATSSSCVREEKPVRAVWGPLAPCGSKAFLRCVFGQKSCGC